MSDPQAISEYRDRVASRYLVKLLIAPDTGRILDASQAAADFYGQSVEELRQLSAWDLTPRSREDTLALLKAVASGQEPSPRLDSGHRRHNGEPRDVMVYPDLIECGGRVLILATVVDVTEHRQTEARLRQSEEQLRALVERLRLALEGARMGTWHWDLVTNEVIWSDVCCALFGVPPGTPSSLERFLSSVHPRCRAASEQAVRKALEERGDYTDECLIVWPDCSEHWIRAMGRFYYAAEGTPQRMEGVVQDITGQKAAERARSASNERLRLFIDQAPVALAVFDREMRYLAISQRWRDDYGLGDCDVSGLTHYEVYPEIPESWRQVHRRGLAGETVRSEDDRFERADGSVQWVRWEVLPWHQEDGEVGGILIFSEEITQRREAEQRLRESERRFADAMEATSDGVWDWDVATGATYYSPGYARMLGYAPDELAPRMDTWLDLLHPDERAAVLVRAQHALENSGYHELEFRMRTKAGGYRWVLSRGKVIERAADSTLLRVVGTHIDITERKETELELRRYRQIVQCSGERLVFLDPDLRYQVVNPAYAAMYHWTGEALQGRAMAEVAPPAVWAQVQPHLEAALAGEPQRFKMEAAYPDGYSWYLEAQAQPFWEDGRVQGIVVSLHDLTEMRAVQAALEAERAHLDERVAERTAELQILAERLQLATDAGRIGVFDMDLTTGQIIWDARLRTLYGVPDAAPQLHWQTWLEWVAPEHRGLLQDSFDRLLRGEATTYQGELLVHCPDGQDRYIASRARLLKGHAGTSPHLVGINWDITAERTAALALAASEAKARAVIDASPMPLAITDGFGPVRYLNAAFVRTFGYTLEDMPTWEHWRRLAYPDPVERARIARLYQERLAQIERTGESFGPLEIAMRCKDGRTRIVMASTTFLGGEEWLNTGYDVTDLKQAQAAAEQAARAKSEFLAHMSHEIRTPLNAVLGLAQVLERTALGPDQLAMVRLVHRAGSSLLSIVNDILDLSKIEAGRLRLEALPFTLDQVLTAVDDLHGPTAHDKGLALTIEPPPALAGALRGDPLRLEQVLVNLVGNALKFTERGEVRVRSHILTCTAEAVRLRFEVVDTGIGISPEIMAGLFVPFAQGDDSMTRRFGGTGLGLAICKRLVEAMGGEIGVESVLAQGSRFWFELGLARTAEVPALAPASLPDSLPASSRLAGLRVLIADDSAMNREVAMRMLALEGARATPAADGQEALDCLRADPQGFDLVLMDVQMPTLDGLAAARLIRAELGLTELPILALTAGVLPEQQAAARAAGMNDVLTKPLDADRMAEVLSRWAGRTRETRAAPVAPATETCPDGVEGLPEIPGIDPVRVARTLGGSRALFQSLLDRFTEESAGAVDEARRALAAGEREAAARHLHGLCGNAGTVGAMDIVAAARGLEAAILQGATVPDEPLEALGERVAALLAASAPWLMTEVTTAAAPPPLDAGQVKVLRESLRRNNLDALSQFDALRPALAGAMGEARTAALSHAVRSLHFAEALAVLDETLPCERTGDVPHRDPAVGGGDARAMGGVGGPVQGDAHPGEGLAGAGADRGRVFADAGGEDQGVEPT